MRVASSAFIGLIPTRDESIKGGVIHPHLVSARLFWPLFKATTPNIIKVNKNHEDGHFESSMPSKAACGSLQWRAMARHTQIPCLLCYFLIVIAFDLIAVGILWGSIFFYHPFSFNTQQEVFFFGHTLHIWGKVLERKKALKTNIWRMFSVGFSEGPMWPPLDFGAPEPSEQLSSPNCEGN